MALYPGFGGGGEEYQETVLWTNTSPTTAFGQQLITLDYGKFSDYKYLKIKSRASTTNDTEFSIVVEAEEFLKLGVIRTSPSVYNLPNTSRTYSKYYDWRSDTTVFVSNTVDISTAGAANTWNIPLQIIGCNKVDPSTKVNVDGIVAKAWSEITGFLYRNIQNSTITFPCNVGDFIIVLTSAPSNVTGAELIGSSTASSYICYVYKATATSVVMVGTGSVAPVIVFENSKTLSDHFTNITTQGSNLNAAIVANKGDIVITNAYSTVPWNTLIDPEADTFRHLVPLGYLSNQYLFLVAETNNAKYYTNGSTYNMKILHFN